MRVPHVNRAPPLALMFAPMNRKVGNGCPTQFNAGSSRSGSSGAVTVVCVTLTQLSIARWTRADESDCWRRQLIEPLRRLSGTEILLNFGSYRSWRKVSELLGSCNGWGTRIDSLALVARAHPFGAPRCGVQNRAAILSNDRFSSSQSPSRKRKTSLAARSTFMAGGLGFEPRLAESESAVLPLDDPPRGRQA